ncbi:MAG TPA: hypothetical protein VLJ68_02710, partial [Chitinophagaceae bacterium]|nr:hypothetical protein [Chitinophagaceae bacterium]
IFHYNNIVSFRENKKFLQEHFPKKLSGIQMKKLEVLYEQMMEDDELMNELEEIIQYSAAEMKSIIHNGTEIYEFVEEKMDIAPVGLVPLDTQEGYFFLRIGNHKITRVYQYRLSIFEKHDEKYRSIRTAYIDGWEHNLSNTYENIKSELIRHRQQLPNPAVYSIESRLSFPIDETLLPVAKRRLVKYITLAA